MIHVYKSGGPWTSENGQEYDIKCINRSDLKKYKDSGWLLENPALQADPDEEVENPKKAPKKAPKKTTTEE